MCEVVLKECKRCRKKLAGIRKSIYGVPDDIRNKYINICSNCATEEEKREIRKIQSSYILGNEKE